jgi:flavin reductase (DIM6/NTAB) family NADH-FMN oxidoreductase RutF
MRRLASGVAIITTSHEGRRYGMTATALMSLSMDPPSFAVGLVQRRAFCVNLLHESYADLRTSFSVSDGQRGEHSVVDWGQPRSMAATRFCVGEAFRMILSNRFTPLIYLNGSIGPVRGHN